MSESQEKLEPLVVNLIKEAVLNDHYRKVIYTTARTQKVLMSLLPKQEIGYETHDGDQSITVVKGKGILLFIDPNNPEYQLEYDLHEGIDVEIPEGTYHNIINKSDTLPLKLYTTYSPPQHIPYLDEILKPK